MVHVFRCPECGAELCADPGCRDHAVDVWAAIHSEEHPLAIKALLLYGECRHEAVE